MAWLLSTEPMTLWEIQESARNALRREAGGCTSPVDGGAAGGRARGTRKDAAPAGSRRGEGDGQRKPRVGPPKLGVTTGRCPPASQRS